MGAKIDTLIEKRDNFVLIRDELAAILFVEKENQKSLAVAAGKNPELWDFDVYTERYSPWLLLENDQNEITSETPLVNVTFDAMNNIDKQSNPIEQQKLTGTFNIDILSAKNDRRIENGDIIAGDELAARDSQRIIELCRNILMSNIYTYIFTGIDETSGFPVSVRGIVSARMFSNIQTFVPQINDRPAQHVMGARMQMRIDFLEFSPQISGPELKLISAKCLRTEDGLIYFQADTDTV